MKRMDRGEFFAKLDTFDEERLRKALWNLYWRGSGSMRERIEAEIDPVLAEMRKCQSNPPVDADDMLYRVQEFDGLARSGVYLGRSRRVSPSERTRWRFTFKQLVTKTQAVLCSEDFDVGVETMEILLDLARDTGENDYFRSEDPLEAAGFVVSEAAGFLWTRMRDAYGVRGLAERAPANLVRWESLHGWTRHGGGRVAKKETSLAGVLDGLVSRAPDVWLLLFDRYLEALGTAVAGGVARSDARWPWFSTTRERRCSSLAEWHSLLLVRCDKGDCGPRFERLVKHEAFAGPSLMLLEARVAQAYGQMDRARRSIVKALKERPRDPMALMLAKAMDVPAPA